MSAATPGARAAGNAAALAAAAVLASASPKRFLASSSALRLASSSWRWRSSSALRRAAAGFMGFAFGLLDAFLAVAALRLGFGETAFLDVADLGVGQRIGARGALFL